MLYEEQATKSKGAITHIIGVIHVKKFGRMFEKSFGQLGDERRHAQHVHVAERPLQLKGPEDLARQLSDP